MTVKNVHTEHCCILHGCKYGDEYCPVVLGLQRQSYPCEDCDELPSVVVRGGKYIHLPVIDIVITNEQVASLIDTLTTMNKKGVISARAEVVLDDIVLNFLKII